MGVDVGELGDSLDGDPGELGDSLDGDPSELGDVWIGVVLPVTDDCDDGSVVSGKLTDDGVPGDSVGGAVVVSLSGVVCVVVV